MWISDDHARVRSPKDPDRREEGGQVLSPREKLIYELEEVLGIQTDIWEKKRATIKNEDLKKIHKAVMRKLDVEPAKLHEQEKEVEMMH